MFVLTIMMMKLERLLIRGAGNHAGEEEADVAPAHKRGKSRLESLLPFLRWWLNEIKAMLPPSIRKVFSEHRVRVRASHGMLKIIDPNSAVAEERCHLLGSVDAIGSYVPGTGAKQRCDLLLDESMVLVRDLELPLEAERTLRRVLSFSMDRYTPFTEADVIFDYRIIRRDAADKKIYLMLYVAPRESVESIISELARMGLEPATIDVVTTSMNGQAGIDMCLPEWRSDTTGLSSMDKLLGLSALILLLAAVVVPVVQRQQAASGLERQLAGVQAQLQASESDRRALVERIEYMRQIQQQTSAMPAVLDVLLELTRLMPDESWAGQVSLKGGRVRLSGEASAASELLAQLSKSSIFSDPRFEAPLTQNPKTGHERFVISLAIRKSNDAP